MAHPRPASTPEEQNESVQTRGLETGRTLRGGRDPGAGVDAWEKGQADAVRDATKGLGVRAVFDFVGVDATMPLATSVVRQRGKVTVVGIGGGTFPFRFGALSHATTIGFTFGGSIADLAEGRPR